MNAPNTTASHACNRALVTLAFMVGACACMAGAVNQDAAKPASQPAATQPQAYDEAVPGTTLKLRMVLVPRGQDSVAPLYLSATEITWDLYDHFVYGETSAAEGSAKGADAVTRPSKPYLPPDRGFGHAGYPALSMSHYAAEQFCQWLSKKTGHRYRLPTEAEWSHACAANAPGAAGIADTAWFTENSEDKTHPAGSKAAGAIGLYDMHGNAAEWVTTAEGKPMTCGGSYRDEAQNIGCAARVAPSANWNASDPQLPKSKWWLADCTFVGFRVAREIE